MGKKLLSEFSNLKFSVSATTRPPRAGETDGREYHFLSKNEFEKKVRQNQFLEWEEFYNGTRYGTLKADVESELEKGYFVMLDVDVLGALHVKQLFDENALTIFIKPPSLNILEQRLRNRGTETEESISTRLKRAEKEIQYSEQFDLVVVNDKIDAAYSKIKAAVQQFISKKVA